MIRSSTIRVPVIYVAVQLLAYGIELGSFSLIRFGLETDVVIANVAAKVFAGCFALFAHRNITFSCASEQPLFSQAAKYFFILLINSFLASALLALLLHFATSVTVLIKIGTDVIMIVVSFAASKAMVFRPLAAR